MMECEGGYLFSPSSESSPMDFDALEACPSGADLMAENTARDRGLRIERYPADWEAHGRSAGPIRNARMIAEGRPKIGFGFRSDGESRGTDDMTRKLRAKGIPALVMLEGGVGEAEGLKTSEVEWEQLQIEEA